LELSMRQTLHLLNSSDVQNKINASPRLRRLFQEVKDDAAIVEELFFLTLSRAPTEEEKNRVLAYVSGNNPEALARAEAEKKTAEETLAKVKGELDKATADYDAAEKAANANLAEANQKINAAKAPRSGAQKQQALQDLLWAILNTKEFLFNH